MNHVHAEVVRSIRIVVGKMCNKGLDFFNSINSYEIKPGLDRMRKLLNKMGNFHENLRVIHVAGTNGKGSTSAFINRILVDQGYTVGCFNSPWLFKINECIRVNDEEISDDGLEKVLSLIQKKLKDVPVEEYPSSFEVLTVCAFSYFVTQGCDFVVLECGMGGNDDATNIIKKSLISVFTPISFDHQAFLGDSVDKIAWNKAQIMKKSLCSISAKQDENVKQVLLEQAKKFNKEIVFIEDYDYSMKVSLLGDFQKENANLAVAVVYKLRDLGYELDEKKIAFSLKKTTWPLRLEVLSDSPTLIVDGAHNSHGICAVVSCLKNLFYDKKIKIIYGGLKDKDIYDIIRIISFLSKEINLIKPENERARSLSELKIIAEDFFEVINLYDSTDSVLEDVFGKADKEDVIVALGSLYVAKEIKEAWGRRCFTKVREE